tara:strand:- start:318 stop:449 length:132 start_codon:yes stop_codon:yes gene_type:complete
MKIEIRSDFYQTLLDTREKYAKVVGMLVVSVIINIAFTLEMLL